MKYLFWSVSLLFVAFSFFSCHNDSQNMPNSVLAEMRRFVDGSNDEQPDFYALWQDTINHLAQHDTSPKAVYSAACHLGLSLLRAGRQADAVLYFSSILNACDSCGMSSTDLDNDFRLQNYVCLGAAMEEIGLKNAAITTYKDGLDLAQKTDNKEYMAMLLNNIGVLYDSVDDLEAALDYYQKALQINLSLKDKNLQEIYLNYMNISSAYAKKGDIQQAIDLSLKALQYINASDSETHYTHAVTLASLYQKIGNTPLAISYIDNAIVKLDSLSHVPMLIAAMQVKSDILRQTGAIDNALSVNAQAFDMAESVDNLHSQLTLLKQRALIEHTAGNHLVAYSLLEKSEAISDSLAKADANAHQLQLQTLLNRDTVQESILKQNNHVWTVILFSLIIILIALTLMLFRKRTKRMSNAHKQAMLMNVESEALLKDNLHKTSMILLERARANEQLNAINCELKDYLRSANIKNAVDKSKLSQVINKIEQITHRTDWKELQFYLENSNEQFVEALEQRFPNLTTKDKRLCILIRLMLSNKEISALTSLEVKSVETARTRLRKKMGLDREVNMADFLRSL